MASLPHQGLFALHSVAEPVYRQIEATFLESEKCDIATVDYLVTFDSFTPVRKGSPYLELIRVVSVYHYVLLFSPNNS